MFLSSCSSLFKTVERFLALLAIAAALLVSFRLTFMLMQSCVRPKTFRIQLLTAQTDQAFLKEFGRMIESTDASICT